MVTSALVIAFMKKILWQTCIIMTAYSMTPSLQQGTLEDSLELQRSTREEVEDLFSCPLNHAGMRTQCINFKLSCCGRCGSFIEDYPTFPNDSYISCSCDEMCPVYRDCCWDFESICPDKIVKSMELKEAATRLSNAKLDCISGTVVLTYPDKPDGIRVSNETVSKDTNYEQNDTPWETRDFREPIIYMDGLQFENISVYKYYFPAQLPDYVVWKKRLAMEFASHKELADFFLEGKVSINVREGLEDIPPAGIKKRMCKAGMIRIMCESCQQDTFIINIDHTQLSEVCKKAISYLPEIMATHSSTSVITSSVYPLFQAPKTGLCGYDTYDSFDVCTSGFNKLNRVLQGSLFSILMSFSQATGVHFNGFQAAQVFNWQALKYIEGGQDSTNQLIKICNPGFVFNGDSCIRPETVFIRIVHGIQHTHAMMHHIHLFKQLIQDNFQTTELEFIRKVEDIFKDKCIKFMYDETARKHKITFDIELVIKNYNLKYNGTMLPVTNEIIHYIIRNQEKEDLLYTNPSASNPDQLLSWVCLVSRATFREDAIFIDNTGKPDHVYLCDRLLWKGQDVFIVHGRFEDKSNLSLSREDLMKDAINGYVTTKVSGLNTQNHRSPYDNELTCGARAVTVTHLEIVTTTMSAVLSLTLVLLLHSLWFSV